MRVEAGKTDGHRYRVWLGSTEMRDCRMADDEAGEIERFVRDDQGRFVIDWDSTTRERVIRREVLRGDVFIERVA